MIDNFKHADLMPINHKSAMLQQNFFWKPVILVYFLNWAGI